MLNCGIIGATGYTGMELIRILSRHPGVCLAAMTTRSKVAVPVQSIISKIPRSLQGEVRFYTFDELKRKCDVVFICLPHTEAMEAGARFYRAGKIVIDLSADFRLQSWRLYEAWYNAPHRHRALLKHAVYGLPEIYRAQIAKSRLIANPGCYPTSAILGIYPLLKAGLVDSSEIVIDSKSGVSGAGKKLTPGTQYCEANENFSAYKVNRHRHRPEIQEVLSREAGRPVEVTFVTHLLPLNRGILSTIYLRKKKGASASAVRKAFERAYGDEPFVRLTSEGLFPSLREVQNTNECRIGVMTDSGSGRVIVVSAIDNLVKGASGQAVQNMNIVCGFPEEEGLE